MAEPPSNAIRNAVLGAIATTAVGALFALVPPTWQWFTDALKTAWVHAQANTALPNWALYALGMCAVYCLWKGSKSVYRQFKNAEPSFKSYTEDQFFNAKWRWHYYGGAPSGIWAYCPRCDTQLVYSEASNFGEQRVTLTCEHCNSAVLSDPGDKDYLVAKVARQIDRKLRSGEWKARVQSGGGA